MPWKEQTAMTQRQQFIQRVRAGDQTIAQLCREFGICRSTAHKWLRRYQTHGPDGLAERSRRPAHSPAQTSPALEHLIVELRQHVRWGGRKLAHLLDGAVQGVPAPSTITDILRRHGAITPEASDARQHYQRFERAQPNELWQMDFKGHFAMAAGRCHPLAIVDDHSRFNIVLQACPDEKLLTVQAHLERAFKEYGLPERLLADNGRPWSGSTTPHTQLTAWLIRLGVRVSHGRPWHPQTQGKTERFNQTLKSELLTGRLFQDLADAQRQMDPWRHRYNHQRPHEALGMQPPASRYQPSPRPFPRQLPPIEYECGDIVRKVGNTGEITFNNRWYFVCEAFRGYPVALRPGVEDGAYEVYFCREKIAQIHLKSENGTR